MPKARVQKRLYYKIGEACKAIGIQPYVLRYWETEFPALSPSKSRSGQRVYSERELEVIRRIKVLLYDEGYTIAGAKKKLEAELSGASPVEAVSSAPRDLFREAAQEAPADPGETVEPLAPRASPPPLSAAPSSPRSVRRPTASPAPRTPPPTLRDVADLPIRHSALVPEEAPRPADPLATAMPLPLVHPQPAEPQPPRSRAGEPGEPPAAPPPASDALPPPALDSASAQQIQRLRTGIQKALQEAREILALLDSRTNSL